ncbi:MAG: lysophospholipid acyltransferase family protein [Chitinispirillaceae bacterium]|nr:lysophospholipid acyltransferase family protein [Chitinispirillaceae bacterium]
MFRHFRSFGISLIDRYILTRGMRDAKRFRFDYINESVIEQEAFRGGVILLGAHMGNWEIAGALLGKRLRKPVHVFMYDDQPEATGNASVREKDGVIIHPVQADGADIAVEVVNALRSGEIVCLHGDRYFEGQRTVEIGFLGKPALFPAGPMAMAMITGATVLPCFTLRTSLFHYEFSSATPIRPQVVDRCRRDAAIREATEQYVRILEATCRRYPDQWYNFYRYWK